MLGRWFIAKSGSDGTRTFGPFSCSQLAALAEAHKLLPADLICQENSSAWLPASSQTFLAAFFAGSAQACAVATAPLPLRTQCLPEPAHHRSPWRTPLLVLCTGVCLIGVAGGALVALWPQARQLAHVPTSQSASVVTRSEPSRPTIVPPPTATPVTTPAPVVQGVPHKAVARTLDELFDRDEGPSDFSRADWKVLKRRLYAEGVLGHTEVDGAFEFRNSSDKYLGVLRAMRDVFHDHGFTQPTPQQIFNGAKFFVGGSLTPEGGVRIRTTGILAKRAGMPLMSRRDYEQLDRAE